MPWLKNLAHAPVMHGAALPGRAAPAFGLCANSSSLSGAALPEKGPLTPDPQFPPALLREATIHQVAYDIDVFMSVLGQREKEVGTPAMQKTLAMADRLAADALAPAVRHRLVEQTAVLTYFQKATTIRLIPYAPLALVGFDLTALVELPRLLAVGARSWAPCLPAVPGAAMPVNPRRRPPRPRVQRRNGRSG
ncbi:MAG: hypothetical protein IPK16_34115 [Anaerolineales bacterium]|nr:hypothetical protein [Anaerolineales bacterium]